MSGKFIVFEGVDGSGKSSTLDKVVSLLKGYGFEVVLTREPGGTPLGEKVRDLLLYEEMHPETEALLMFAARREHVEKVILPALKRGAIVVSDRFVDSSFAYQCGGRGLSVEKMRALEFWTLEGLTPDLTLFFDLPVEVSMKRLESARVPDKFEKQGKDFFESVRQAYHARIALDEAGYRIIDAKKSMEEVWTDVQEVLTKFMQ